MTQDWLAHCLTRPGAWQDQPWQDTVVAKVGPKIFAFLGVDGVNRPAARPTTIGLKCGDREAADLRLERYPGSATPMAYLARYGWNSFSLDGTIPEDDLTELIDDSYALVVAGLPRSRRP